MTGLDPGRVAEIVVTGSAGERSGRTSGYRVTSEVVLTAEHAVRGRTDITVRFDADQATEWTVPASVMWSDPTEDGALLILGLPAGTAGVAASAYGRLGDRPAVIDAQAVGFPWWKLKVNQAAGEPVPSYRDMHQADCLISALSNRRSHTLELATDPPNQRPDPGRSPWEGMSGAAVWAGNRIVGVVREHALAEGPNHLTATRMDRLIRAMPPTIRQVIGVTGDEDIADVLDTAATVTGTPAAGNIKKSLVGTVQYTAVAVLAWLAGGRRPHRPDAHVPAAGYEDHAGASAEDPLSAMHGDGSLLDFDV
jgi:hypothetical protein